jgi:hypothetical protein
MHENFSRPTSTIPLGIVRLSHFGHDCCLMTNSYIPDIYRYEENG